MTNRASRTLIDMAFGGAALGAAFAAGADPARAAGGYCGDRDRIIAQLETRHGETRRSVGLQQNAPPLAVSGETAAGLRVMETYANAETGSWTIIVAMPSGLACLVAAGEAYQEEAARTPVGMLDDPA